jgi:hypothetical protein
VETLVCVLHMFRRVSICVFVFRWNSVGFLVLISLRNKAVKCCLVFGPYSLNATYGTRCGRIIHISGFALPTPELLEAGAESKQQREHLTVFRCECLGLPRCNDVYHFVFRRDW